MGTINLAALLQKIEDGDGTDKDLASLMQLCGFVKGRGYCTVVTGAAVVVQSSLEKFRHEFEAHIAEKRCPYHPDRLAVAGGVA
jgi:NADH-quinone oxidoreductase subunit F